MSTQKMLAGRVSKALTEKTSRRTQKYRWNSSKNKYYAIVGGKNGFTGVVDNWDACKDLVHRVRNTRYKSFKRREAAEEFVKTLAGLGEDFGTFLFHVPFNEPFTCVNPQYKEQGKRILKLYTDGACISNGSCSAKAGYGVYFGDGDSRNISRPLLGQVQTNQRAELSAMIAALESVCKEPIVYESEAEIYIYTDSRYVKDILTAGWLEQWKLNHWKRKVGELKNLDLIQRLDYLWNKVHQQSKAKIEIVWVKGHDGLKGNEEADRLATLGIHQRLSRDNV
ncbi:ribonuclease HI [Galdieria sulphuraria]|uniref:ribonuclease H n=1 Tax=Galdieria sulphuraria TaxID=130081 RepID=M2VZV3_GALSU|nr:ribonuclease HI [Galdieria sulphuraria]EME28876.1 ribonuclease HI [Galdieria sulphuraria]|eukprot:XP_005705396.1 ribonuclease HI [Galdieria sulphuraria]